jgi:hypothetical protein
MRKIRQKAREIEHRVVRLDREMVKWTIEKWWLIELKWTREGEKKMEKRQMTWQYAFKEMED